MNVYVKYQETKEFLKSQELNDITMVDNPLDSHYMITGQYSRADYHKDLKGIIIPYTGHNGINLDDMRQADLKLFITTVRSKYTAEKAVTLTLSLLGNVINYHNLLKKGDWSNRNSESRVPWVSIQNKRIGLYGYGRIGKMIHKMLKGFNCNFYTIDRNKEYTDINLVKDLTNLIQVSDVIIVAIPLNIETENSFYDKMLNLMKDKYLVNVGRGRIVNQKALYEALKNHTLKGFASDVWYNYPKDSENCFPSDYPIHELNNVVLSNHSGGFTKQTNEEVNLDLVKQLIKLRDEDYSDALDLTKLI